MGILAFKALSKTLAGGRTLFANIAASIDTPSSIALIAPSGHGKSTLLRLLALLDEPSGGEVLLEDRSSAGWEPQAWRCKAAYVAQQAVMLPGSVEWNLRAFSRLHGTAFDEAGSKALMAAAGLSATGWSEDADTLSGGEKQRVSLVRSLLARPEILLLDEVTASLDRHSKDAVEKMLLALHAKSGTSLVWVTHDLEQARRVSTRIWFLADGSLWDGESEAFFRQPPTEAAAQFLKQRTMEAVD